MIRSIKSRISANGIYYVVILCLSFTLKYFYSHAGSDDLAWVITPTAWLVEHLSGISFIKEIQTGYFSPAHAIIIAPACAGLNFLIIFFCMSSFSFVHRFQKQTMKAVWVGFCLFLSYMITLLVNALRIDVSIQLYKASIYNAWITPDRVHRIEGVVIYFFFLCTFYFIMNNVIKCENNPGEHVSSKDDQALNSSQPLFLLGSIPLFWYVAITLIIPFLNNAHIKNPGHFMEHALLVSGSCCVVLIFILWIRFLLHRIMKPYAS